MRSFIFQKIFFCLNRSIDLGYLIDNSNFIETVIIIERRHDMTNDLILISSLLIRTIISSSENIFKNLVLYDMSVIHFSFLRTEEDNYKLYISSIYAWKVENSTSCIYRIGMSRLFCTIILQPTCFNYEILQYLSSYSIDVSRIDYCIYKHIYNILQSKNFTLIRLIPLYCACICLQGIFDNCPFLIS